MVFDVEYGHFLLMKTIRSNDNNKIFKVGFKALDDETDFTTAGTKLTVNPSSNRASPNIFYPELQVSSITRFVGQKASFTCAVEGDPLPTLEWYKDASSLPSNVQRPNKFSIDIQNLTMGNNGFYECNIGTNSKKFELVVKEHLRFVKVPENKNLTVEDNDISWDCSAYPDSSDLSIQWYINSSDILPQGFLIDQEKRLTLDSAQLSSNGVIECRVLNEKTKESVFKSAYVVVFSKIIIESQPKPTYNITEEKEITLMVKGSNDARLLPPLKFTWYKDDLILNLDQNLYRVDDKVFNEHRLLFINVQNTETDGEYFCELDNGVAKVETNRINVFRGNPSPIPVVAQSAFPWWILAIIAAALIIFILVLCLCLWIQRNKGEDYKVDALERKQGLDPEAELKAEDFKSILVKH